VGYEGKLINNGPRPDDRGGDRSVGELDEQFCDIFDLVPALVYMTRGAKEAIDAGI